MATLVSRELSALREDWDETIHIIDSTKCPLTSEIGSEKVDVNNPQWIADDYGAVDLDNARDEGADPVEANDPDLQVLTTYLQHMDITVKVSDVADKIKKAGRKGETTRLVLKALARLKRGYEGICTNDQVAVGNTIRPKLGSFQSQVDASLKFATGSTSTDVTEALLLSALEDLYQNGAEPDMIMVSPDDSLKIAAFDKAAGRHRDINKSKTIVNAVELYVSPFGEQHVVLNRFSKPGDWLIFNPEDWTKLVMFPWETQELGKSGRNTKVQVFGTYGLKLKNPKAAAVIRAKTTGTAGADGKFRF